MLLIIGVATGLFTGVSALVGYGLCRSTAMREQAEQAAWASRPAARKAA